MATNIEFLVEIIKQIESEDFQQLDGSDPIVSLNEIQTQALAAATHAFIFQQIKKLLPTGVGGNAKKVVCQLPGNIEVIARSIAVQCQQCSDYFCQRHKLTKCPTCLVGDLQ